jgi:UDP-N-acetylglucosamine 2-epimerase (non-hydrolysing)
VKVLTIVGTRPELIRLSRVIARLDDELEHRLVHTGQNWDPQLRDIFFTELGLRAPDHWLDVPVSSLGATLGGVLTAIEPVLLAERPDAVLVLGDTNSCLAAIMAKRLGIPVFHMEAGNRSFDENVPEETNRRIIDHTADFNLCYTEHARRNLLAEGLPARRIFVTGSPLAEVLAAYADRIDASSVLDRLGLEPGGYYLVSMHREENVDDPARLAVLTAAIAALARDTGRRVIVTTHPRLRARLDGSGEPGVEYRAPFGYLDYNKLQRSARCVLSDSGTVSEEAALTPFPAVTIRDSMERPEALDTGTIVLTGVDSAAIARAVTLVCAQWDAGVRPAVPAGYEVSDCSLRVGRLLTGLVGVHAQWLGLRPKRWG